MLDITFVVFSAFKFSNFSLFNTSCTCTALAPQLIAPAACTLALRTLRTAPRPMAADWAGEEAATTVTTVAAAVGL